MNFKKLNGRKMGDNAGQLKKIGFHNKFLDTYTKKCEQNRKETEESKENNVSLKRFLFNVVKRSQYYNTKYNIFEPCISPNPVTLEDFLTDLFLTPEAAKQCNALCAANKLTCDPQTYMSCLVYFLYQGYVENKNRVKDESEEYKEENKEREQDKGDNREKERENETSQKIKPFFISPNQFDIWKYQSCVLFNQEMCVPIFWLDTYDFILWGQTSICPEFNVGYGYCKVFHLLSSNQSDAIVYECRRLIQSYYLIDTYSTFISDIVYKHNMRERIIETLWSLIAPILV